jgi:hypothetical protein
MIKNTLFFSHRKRRPNGQQQQPPQGDSISRWLGTAIPSSIPESSSWWRNQQKHLAAITDDAECGLMQLMVTITHHDRVPEMLANARRGPLARPTEVEKCEYLFTRVRKDQRRTRFDKYALEHVLSFQRRVLAIKEHFLKRNNTTPLGIVHDYFDRTESQQRGALHSHILLWLRRRLLRPEGYMPLDPVPRTAVGTEQKQRPRDQKVQPLKPEEAQEDSVYYYSECGRVVAEMTRPYVGGARYGGYDTGFLRIAGLARLLQHRTYLHNCSPSYCLKDRSSCRCSGVNRLISHHCSMLYLFLP